MKPLQIIILSLLTLFAENAIAQTTDSLSIAPNPFSTSTTIHFEIAESDTITLRVFNSLGHTIKTFFNATILPSGTYNINLLGDSLVNGLYFVRLEIGSTKTITKKVVKTGTASISENSWLHQVLIYPNPTTNYVTINNNVGKIIIISDINGKTLQTYTNEEQVISLSSFSPGQYYIYFLNDKNEIINTSKILKIAE